MTLPSYVAEASLYAVSGSYHSARSGRIDAGPRVLAQHDPCDRGGGGGIPLPPGPCPRGRRCCGTVRNGQCIGQCVPINAQCP